MAPTLLSFRQRSNQTPQRPFSGGARRDGQNDQWTPIAAVCRKMAGRRRQKAGLASHPAAGRASAAARTVTRLHFRMHHRPLRPRMSPVSKRSRINLRASVSVGGRDPTVPPIPTSLLRRRTRPCAPNRISDSRTLPSPAVPRSPRDVIVARKIAAAAAFRGAHLLRAKVKASRAMVRVPPRTHLLVMR